MALHLTLGLLRQSIQMKNLSLHYLIKLQNISIVLLLETQNRHWIILFILIEDKVHAVMIDNLNALMELVKVEVKALFGFADWESLLSTAESPRLEIAVQI